MILDIEARLADTAIDIRRTVRIADSATVADLHLALQVAFDLDDSHFFRLTLADGRTLALKDPDGAETAPDLDADITPLAEVFASLGQQAKYAYDSDDEWEFDVEVLQAQPETDPNSPFGPAQIVAFEGPNLMEDIGGAVGLRELIETLANPSHVAHADTAQALELKPGQTYQQAYAFDPETANAELKELWNADPQDLESMDEGELWSAIENVMKEVESNPELMESMMEMVVVGLEEKYGPEEVERVFNLPEGEFETELNRLMDGLDHDIELGSKGLAGLRPTEPSDGDKQP